MASFRLSALRTLRARLSRRPSPRPSPPSLEVERGLQQHLIMDAERRRLKASTELRALEAATGKTLDDDAGAYWLRRVWALELLVTAVERRDEVAIQRALRVLRGLPVPLCNPEDQAIDAP